MILATLVATVTLSVFAHGLSANPVINRYSGRTGKLEDEAPEMVDVVELPSRKKWKGDQPPAV